jgi:uncharacterized protein (DUF433 family)
MRKKTLGRYVIADPEICHGKPTFLGTRIMVEQVLRQVAKGMTWNAIVREWGGHVSQEAISEAVELARRAFVEQPNTSPSGSLSRREHP